nr:immunoglobulin heavy chain junction region [Macaca mulatta]
CARWEAANFDYW